MNIRLVYMRSPTDGFCIDENWDISVLPRIGERVFLPLGHLEVIEKNEPELILPLGVVRRYDVVNVEHRWDDIAQMIIVQISKMKNPEFNGDGRTGG